MSINSFFPFLHHRYFECNCECNYGTPAAHTRMRGKRRLPEEAKGLVDAPFLMRSRV